jgi:hypothetical protein
MTLLEEYLPPWFFEYMSPIVLLAGGIMALLIVIFYLKDKDSAGYKLSVLLGVILGVLMAVLAVVEGYHAQTYTLILIAISAFTLVIRPFRGIHVAVIVGLFVMAIVFIALGGLNGQTVGGVDLSVLATGWPRILIAFVAGSIIYSMMRFAEDIVKLFGNLLNCWPVLLILGIICIAEAGCMFLGYGSIFDYIRDIPWPKKEALMLMLPL